ncbi:MAG: hypothetical protein IKM08_02395 [Clostridia bacterium]|nr:hypothetical protein [Clostridia bacterium]
MTRKMMAATGLFGAIAVAGAVGLLMGTGNTGARKMVKKASRTMHHVGGKLQDAAHSMIKR